jgi:hypothetical protein
LHLLRRQRLGILRFKTAQGKNARLYPKNKLKQNGWRHSSSGGVHSQKVAGLEFKSKYSENEKI